MGRAARPSTRRALVQTETLTPTRSTTRTPSTRPTRPKPVDPMTQIELKAKSEPIPALTIQSPRDYTAVATRLAGERALRKEIEAFFNAPHPATGMSLKQEARRPWEALCAKEKELLAAVEVRIKALDAALVAYDDEQERIKREREAEHRRAVQAEDDARRAAEVEILRAAGQETLAEEIEATPVVAPLVHVPSATPAVPGLHFRESVTAVVTDPLALICGIARATIYREMARAFRAKAAEPENAKDKASIERCAAYLERGAEVVKEIPVSVVAFKQAELNALLKAHGGKDAKIPGLAPEVRKQSVTREAAV